MSGTTLFMDSDGVVDPDVTNGFFPPVSEDLIGYYELTPDMLTADGNLINLVNPALPATPIGTPVMEADGCLCVGGSSGWNTQLAETGPMTLLSLAMPVTPLANTAAGRIALISNFRGTGVSLMLDGVAAGDPAGGPAAFAGYATGTPVNQQAIISLTDARGWRVRAMRVTPGVGITAFDVTAGAITPVARADARNLNTADPLLIGTSWGSSRLGTAKHLRKAIYAGARSDDDIRDMAAFWVADVRAAHDVVVGG